MLCDTRRAHDKGACFEKMESELDMLLNEISCAKRPEPAQLR